MTLRLVAPVLAASALAAWLGGFDGFARLVLLAAIVAASARLLAAVGDAVEVRGDRAVVALSAVGLASLVAAGAAHAPLLVLGLFVCLGIEALGSPASRPEAVTESAEPAESLSRAA
jgi:hypothetical protein